MDDKEFYEKIKEGDDLLNKALRNYQSADNKLTGVTLHDKRRMESLYRIFGVFEYYKNIKGLLEECDDIIKGNPNTKESFFAYVKRAVINSESNDPNIIWTAINDILKAMVLSKDQSDESYKNLALNAANFLLKNVVKNDSFEKSQKDGFVVNYKLGRFNILSW